MRRRLPALLIGLLSVAATTTAGSPAVAAPPAPAAKATARAAAQTVTLITGDRVTLSGDGGVSVTAGPGRAGMRFVSRKIQDHRYVYPADALALVRSGRVDPRLFDLSTLTKAGYTDRADLPLLVAYPKTAYAKGVRPDAAVRAAASQGGTQVVRDLPVVHSLAVRADRAHRGTLWQKLTRGTSLAAGVDKLWLDGRRQVSLDVSVPQIGAPQAWQAGLDGTGTTVAILDTGIDATHPDLAGQIAASRNFTDTPDVDDTVGHGTHVASIIAGTGAASGGKYRGVAPGAKLVIGKVCGTEFCADSDILAGMAWAAPLAPVVNMSLGGGDTPGTDPLEAAVDTLSAQYDTLFVIAAGNAGTFAPVDSPATADSALAIGAVDDEDQLAAFSSRGPRLGDGAIKPEITAPGVDIVAAKAKNGVIGDPAPVAGYTSLSGTSMATPHVAGSAAILAQQHPDWTARQKKTALMGAAHPVAGTDVFGQGAGRVDVAREITQSVEVDEGTVGFGVQQWPHADDVPVTKPVTYRNLGSAPVTLTLALTGDAPAGVFTLGASTLTVPAGGTAATTLTSDTSAGDTDGVFSGHLTATGAGGLRVVTPYAVTKEVESYDVRVRHIDRDGTSADLYFTSLVDLTTGTPFDITDGPVPGAGTVRLPKGDYGMYSVVFSGAATDDPADDAATMLAAPRLSVGSAQTVTVDARQGKPMTVGVPQAGTSPAMVVVNADWVGDDFSSSSSLLSDRLESTFSAPINASSDPSFTGSFVVTLGKMTEGSFRNSPYLYDLAWFYPGRLPAGLRKVLHNRDLASIKGEYATEADGAGAYKTNSAVLDEDSGYWSAILDFDLPFSRSEYVNVDGGGRWKSEFDQTVPSDDPDWPFPIEISGATGPLTTYQGGRTYLQNWNRAVFAPSVTQGEWVFRAGDQLVASVPMFGEGSGRPGWSSTDELHYSLYSGDKLVGESDEGYLIADLPAATTPYRLEVTATRSAPHTLSTQVSASWTFTSGHVTGEQAKPQALSTVRISPQLDVHNTAPAGRAVEVPLTVGHQSGGSAGQTAKLTGEVSYDDGKTWTTAAVRGSGDHWSARLRHPAGPGFVSLRLQLTDTAGNTTSTTVIRAYAIG